MTTAYACLTCGANDPEADALCHCGEDVCRSCQEPTERDLCDLCRDIDMHARAIKTAKAIVAGDTDRNDRNLARCYLALAGVNRG